MNDNNSKMGRPRRSDRSSVATQTLTLRMTVHEMDALRAVVEQKEQALQKLVPGQTLSIASYVRGLIQASVAESVEPSPAAKEAVAVSAPQDVTTEHEAVELGRRCKAYRAAKGLSQAQLAKTVSVSTGTKISQNDVSFLENEQAPRRPGAAKQTAIRTHMKEAP